MSAKAVIAVLADLIKVHKELNQIAVEKTEVVKKGEMAALDMLIKKESPFIHHLGKLEEKRVLAVEQFINEKGLVTEDVTMKQLIERAPQEEQTLLLKLYRALLSEIDILKKNNQLNQQLIEDSLRFVNLSLDLLTPEPEEVTYQRPTKNQYETGSSRSIFDSKA
ncbi:flagellar protein FlgN [Alkalihalobacterium elongatum]|uniref:flagellar protein FlgN n=1 Tax=Alkalihalobacterium elongatum TaxID=2675466 RepID=UPI001C1F455A|nr:flagellar protein FlgN [Alkalihalobacterium elongatum]